MNSTCIPDVGYFDTPGFLSLVLHTNTVISTPLHLFGFYCILGKSPGAMKSAKLYLFNLHLWIVLFDYSFSILTIPFLLVPHFAGYPLGVLAYFDLSVLFQITMVFFFLANMLVSVAVLFESRFHTVCTFTGKHHWTRWRRVWIGSFHCAVSSFVFSFLFLAPEQETAKRNMFMKLPCLPQYIYQAKNYVLTEDVTYHLIGCVIMGLTFGAKTIAFGVALLHNSIIQLKSKTMSQKTFELQKTFLIALVAQASAPILNFALPAIYLWISMANYYYNQALTNIAVCLLSMHGFMSSAVMIMAHRPYRKTLLDFFAKRKTRSEENSRRILSYHRNISIGPVIQ